jgi:pimeloyl-ACP methyl ester carboxylesterase
MQRREFIAAAAGTLAIGGCASDPRQAAGTKSLDATAFHNERRFAQLPMGRIAYIQRGTGPAALFLHGFPLCSYQWRGAIERLSAHRRCVAPDFMGLGFSQIATGQSCTPAAQVEMLAALLDSLEISSVDLIANDSGGAVAQLFMLKHPARVRTLLLTNCDVEPDSPPAALLPVVEMARAGTFADNLLGAWVADKNLARSEQGLGGMTFTYPERLSDDAIDIYLGPLVSTPERKALVHAYTLGLDPNPLAGIEPALRSCRTPTRIIWGTGDNIFSQSNPDYLHGILPNSRGVRRVPGAKLFFPEEYPELIAEELRALWEMG